MIMFGLKFMGDVPFREVYVHGLVRDGEGQKMSKSKGNVIDPLDIVEGITLEALVAKRTTGLMQPHLAPAIEKATRKQFPAGIEPHGTDALRFTFAALATQSRDIRFDLGRVGGYRNFCNKLWNAARFVLMMTEGKPVAPRASAESAVDRWIVSRLRSAIATTEAAFDDYRFDFAATALYEFTWHEFCDWYLELSKPVLQGEEGDAAARTRRVMLDTLESLLRALHPLMPFITEEIWQRIAPLAGAAPAASIMVAPWPDSGQWQAEPAAEQSIAWLKAIVLGVRQIRGEMDISPARRIPLLVRGADANDQRGFAEHRQLLDRLAALDSVKLLEDGAPSPPSAAAVVGGLTLLVPMAGLIEPQAEATRLAKRLEKTRAEIAKATAKLANPSFVDHAPAQVVATERERIAQFETAAASLERQLAAVRELL
jgi:valyl-tRNA synthetase